MLWFKTIYSIRKYSVINEKIISKMKYLNVAEKNDAAKTISAHLSRGNSRRREGFSPYNKIYEFQTSVRGQNADMLMTSVSGHLLSYEFVASFKNWTGCNPAQLFDAPVIKLCSENFQKIKRTLEKEVKSCHGLIIWTDCDSEGENIGFEIIDVCRAIKPTIPVYRAKFSEITAISVKRALENLVDPDEKMSKAVDVRMELDLRIGAAFTRFQTLRLQGVFPTQIQQKLISYGSCQIPTLGFVAQRYKAAENFIPQTFWKIKMSHTVNDLTVEFIWARNRLFDKQCCEAYFMVCQANSQTLVTNVTQKSKNKWRPLPMDTVELEKLGSRKLKLTAKETMTIAEKLYTQGIISYPRTETNMFSNEMDLRPLVEMQTPHSDWGNFANRVLEWGPNPRKGTKSDQAHPPIHPTKYVPDIGGNEKRVYELIVRHFLACVSRDAVGSETVAYVTIADEEFTANGLCIHERNYLDVYPYDRWNAKEIHKYEIGNIFEPTEISMPEGQTTAPTMLTEADLIALMEKHGIGTDATHAEHINTIKEREYIGELDRGYLVPGTIGMGLVEGYDAMNLPLAQPKLRAELESDLKLICDGRKQPEIVLAEQVQIYREAFQTITEKALELDQSMGNRLNETPRAAPVNNSSVHIEEVLKCPKCNKYSMALRTKKDNTGWYIGCIGFPDCKNAIWLPDIKEITVTNEICPRCGPGYKKVSLKFKQRTALSLLNATSNVYTSCLCCDSVLKQLLNISEDSVRKQNLNQNNNSVNNRTNNSNIGTSNSTTNNRRNGNLNTNISGTTTNNNSRVGITSGSNTNNNSSRWNNSTTVSSNNRGTNSAPSNHSSGSGISNNTTAVAGSNWNPGTTSNTARNNNSNNSNQWGSGTSSGGTNNRGGWNSNAGQDNNSIPRENTSNGWGSGNNSAANNQWGTGSNENNRSNWNQRNNTNTALRDNNNRNDTNTNGWGTGNTTVTSDGGNPSTSMWTSRNNNNNNAGGSNANQGDDVLCSKCNHPATKYTVKKDGPNKGRPFYVCKQSEACKFFKWGDENRSPTTTSTSGNFSRGINNNSSFRNDGNPGSSNNNNDSNTGNPRAKRKCGICREEGHTKLKCPRRNDT